MHNLDTASGPSSPSSSVSTSAGSKCPSKPGWNWQSAEQLPGQVVFLVHESFGLSIYYSSELARVPVVWAFQKGRVYEVLQLRWAIHTKVAKVEVMMWSLTPVVGFLGRRLVQRLGQVKNPSSEGCNDALVDLFVWSQFYSMHQLIMYIVNR